VARHVDVALRPWMTRAPWRIRFEITLDTAVSLPGIGLAEMSTVSPSASSTNRCRPWAISDSAANGSPWLPVVISSCRSGGSP
jgi:hypothetical protein